MVPKRQRLGMMRGGVDSSPNLLQLYLMPGNSPHRDCMEVDEQEEANRRLTWKKKKKKKKKLLQTKEFASHRPWTKTRWKWRDQFDILVVAVAAAVATSKPTRQTFRQGVHSLRVHRLAVPTTIRLNFD